MTKLAAAGARFKEPNNQVEKSVGVQVVEVSDRVV